MQNNNSVNRSLNFSAGAQLYAIQSDLEKDLQGTLQKISAIGYTEVEAANLPSKEHALALKQALDSLGLNCRSAQFITPMLFANTTGSVEIAQALGVHYIVASTPWLADPSRKKNSGDPQQDFLDLMQSLTLDDWKWNAERFNQIGEQIKRAGLQFAYHNHGFDFRLTDGEIPFETILRLTDREFVAFELDCGWVVNAGHDPLELFERHPGRVQLLHIKDILKKAPTTAYDMQSVAVGQGCIDWQRVLRAAQTAGIKAGFVELEPPFATPPLEQFTASYDFLSTLKL